MVVSNTDKICFAVKNLRKTFNKGAQPSLNVKDLEIYSGEITAVLGYSAAGKSTLMNLLALLQDYDANADTKTQYLPGEFPAYSMLSASQKVKLRREHFGFIFQDHHLIKHLTAYENIMMPMKLKHQKKVGNRKKVNDLLDFARIKASSRHSFPSTLSGGESQRISVLRAIAHDPRVLFADEPTGSLDPVTGGIVVDMLKRWYEDDPTRTLIIVTHNFNQAYELASRFLIFKNGEVAYDGRKHKDIKNINELFGKIQGL